MALFSVQGSITVKRLRTGATLSFYLSTNGIPLQQFINISNPESVYPDWTVRENQPEITPEVWASSGSTVKISTTAEQGWKYNGSLLVFDGSKGTTEDGWTIDTTGKFALSNDNSFTLRIIANLASEENYASDTLEFTGTMTYEGSEYVMSRSIDVSILQSGTSGYVGYLSYSPTNVLTAEVTETTVSAQLWNGDSLCSGFYTRWYKNVVSENTLFREAEASGTSASITVNRDDIEGGDNNDNQTGGTLLICEFYPSKDESLSVATAGINIADEADEFSLILTTTSSNKTLDTGETVTVTGGIWSLKNSRDFTQDVGKISWDFFILKPDLTQLRTVHVDTTSEKASIEVDYNDSVEDNDVNVTATAEFDYEL